MHTFGIMGAKQSNTSKNIRNKFRHAQHVGRVLVRRKNNSLPGLVLFFTFCPLAENKQTKLCRVGGSRHPRAPPFRWTKGWTTLDKGGDNVGRMGWTNGRCWTPLDDVFRYVLWREVWLDSPSDTNPSCFFKYIIMNTTSQFMCQ